MSNKEKNRNNHDPSKSFWCIIKSLRSGKNRICQSRELYHVSSDQRYWAFCPETKEDFDLKSEYGTIKAAGKTQRMTMNNVLFMSSDEEEVKQAMGSGCLPGGSRLPNPKRRQTLTPMEFDLNQLELMNAMQSARDTRKKNVKAKTTSRKMTSDSIVLDYVNRQRGSSFTKKAASTSKLRNCGDNIPSIEKASLSSPQGSGTEKDGGGTSHDQGSLYNRNALGKPSSSFTKKASTSKLRNCGNNIPSIEKASLSSPQGSGTEKDGGGTSHDRGSLYNRKALGKPSSSFTKKASTSKLRNCGNNIPSIEKASLSSPQGSGTEKDGGGTSHDRGSLYNRKALGKPVSTPESELLQRQLQKLREENDALKAKLIEQESTKSALLKLTEEVGHLKKSVEHGTAAVSQASKSNLSNFVKEGSNPPEIEFPPYKSITLNQMQFIERNVFKFTAKVNKICDYLWGKEVHLYFVRGPKSASNDDVRVIKPSVFERMSDIIGTMKVIKEEKQINCAETAVKRQVEKYTSYKRRQHALSSLPEEEMKKMKLEAKMRNNSRLAERKGRKLFIIKKRKRVYIKDEIRKSRKRVDGDTPSNKCRNKGTDEESDGLSDSDHSPSGDIFNGSGGLSGISDSDSGSVYKSTRKIGGRAVIISSESEGDTNLDQLHQEKDVGESDPEPAVSSSSRVQNLKFNPAHSELLFSELDTASEREVRDFQRSVVPDYGDTDSNSSKDSDETIYISHALDGYNRW